MTELLWRLRIWLIRFLAGRAGIALNLHIMLGRSSFLFDVKQRLYVSNCVFNDRGP